MWPLCLVLLQSDSLFWPFAGKARTATRQASDAPGAHTIAESGQRDSLSRIAARQAVRVVQALIQERWCRRTGSGRGQQTRLSTDHHVDHNQPVVQRKLIIRDGQGLPVCSWQEVTWPYPLLGLMPRQPHPGPKMAAAEWRAPRPAPPRTSQHNAGVGVRRQLAQRSPATSLEGLTYAGLRTNLSGGDRDCDRRQRPNLSGARVRASLTVVAS